MSRKRASFITTDADVAIRTSKLWWGTGKPHKFEKITTPEWGGIFRLTPKQKKRQR